MKIKIAAAGGIAALLLLSGCSSDSDEATSATTSAAAPAASEMASEPAMAEPGTIVEVASANEDFETLVAAVTAAKLVDTLNGDGPFTVFAPTDAAFEALPEGTVDALLLPENEEALAAILTYHVVPGKIMAADVAAGEVETVEGSSLEITTDDGVQVNDANVVATDVGASNGVIHVIDAVLIPPTVDVSAL